MTQARLVVCAYGVLFMLGCSYCGKDQAPVAAAAPPMREASLQNRDCTSCAQGTACNSLGVCVPATWYCGPMYYDGGSADGCDCDCGAPDPDCNRQGEQQHWCYDVGRARQVDSCGACVGAPVLTDVDEPDSPEGS